MTYEFHMTRMVEFAETDMAGIMHFSNYFRFMEATEHAFFRSIGAAVHAQGEGEMRGWARVNATCTYKAPLKYQDVVDVQLLVGRKSARSITYHFVFRRDRAAVAFGSMTAVCVERTPDDPTMRAAAMPAEIDSLITVAPDELLE